MKNRIRIITVLALIFVASYSLRAQRYGSYSIDRLESEVYYEGMYVRGADASTFEDLGYGYGKDRRYVYRYGEVLEYVDPSSFRVSSEFASSYSPDGMRPEHGGYGCGNDYRRYDNGGYYKDNFHVFFRGREIDGAHVTGFEILEDGYAKDSFNVYWNVLMSLVLRFWKTAMPRILSMCIGTAGRYLTQSQCPLSVWAGDTPKTRSAYTGTERR